MAGEEGTSRSGRRVYSERIVRVVGIRAMAELLQSDRGQSKTPWAHSAGSKLSSSVLGQSRGSVCCRGLRRIRKWA